MSTFWQDDVSELQEAFGHPSHVDDSEPIELRRVPLRAELLREEVKECLEAMTGRRVDIVIQDYPGEQEQSLVEAVDGLIDVTVVACGAACEWGVDLQPIWDEVHRTNMAKKDGPVRSDGKRLRPEGWEPPDVAGLIEKQKEERA